MKNGMVHTDVVGVFPNPAALLSVVGSVLVEALDERQVADKRYLSETSPALINIRPERRNDCPRSRSHGIVNNRRALRKLATALTPLHRTRPTRRGWRHPF